MELGRLSAWLVLLACPALSSPLQRYGVSDEERSTLFGYEVEAVGDVDGDGAEDLAIAAPLAWCERGRLGSVLIVSVADERVLARIDGPGAVHSLLGWGLTCLTKAAAGRGGLLAIGCRTGTRVHSLDTRELVALLPRVDSHLASPGDVDGDGTDDWLAWSGVHQAFRWFSGKSWQPLDRAPLGGTLRILDHDFDGDGWRDALEWRGASQVVLRSLRSGAQLARFELGDEPSYSFGTGIRIGLRADEQPCLVFNVLDRSERVARPCAFSAVSGKRVAAGEPVHEQNGDDRYVKLSVHAAPDLDLDGVADFLTMRTPSLQGDVVARSGKTLDVLWRVEDAVDDEHHDAAFLALPREEGRLQRYTLAVGRVQANETYKLYGTDGEVVLIDPIGARVLDRLREAQYGVGIRTEPRSRAGIK